MAADQIRLMGMMVMVGEDGAGGGCGGGSERVLPGGVGEGGAGIFLRSAGGLHHAVEGQERLHGELHVTADEAGHSF